MTVYILNPVNSRAKTAPSRYSLAHGRHTWPDPAPPGNQNAFRHGLTGIAQRRVNGALTPAEQSIREEILNDLITDKGGEAQISTAMRMLAEGHRQCRGLVGCREPTIDGVMESNQKARNNPKALHTLDGYKRGLVNSLTGNLQRFGFERFGKTETLEQII